MQSWVLTTAQCSAGIPYRSIEIDSKVTSHLGFGPRWVHECMILCACVNDLAIQGGDVKCGIKLTMQPNNI